jgi:hypothetical protein
MTPGIGVSGRASRRCYSASQRSRPFSTGLSAAIAIAEGGFCAATQRRARLCAMVRYGDMNPVRHRVGIARSRALATPMLQPQPPWSDPDGMKTGALRRRRAVASPVLYMRAISSTVPARIHASASNSASSSGPSRLSPFRPLHTRQLAVRFRASSVPPWIDATM